jgi:hypothetical protein
MLLCSPALLGGCIWFCILTCDEFEFSRWGPGDAFVWAPVQPGKRVRSLLYNVTNSSGAEGGFIMAGPGRMAWLGFVCFSAFWARKARLAWSRRMQLRWSVNVCGKQKLENTHSLYSTDGCCCFSPSGFSDAGPMWPALPMVCSSMTSWIRAWLISSSVSIRCFSRACVTGDTGDGGTDLTGVWAMGCDVARVVGGGFINCALEESAKAVEAGVA